MSAPTTFEKPSFYSCPISQSFMGPIPVTFLSDESVHDKHGIHALSLDEACALIAKHLIDNSELACPNQCQFKINAVALHSEFLESWYKWEEKRDKQEINEGFILTSPNGEKHFAKSVPNPQQPAGFSAPANKGKEYKTTVKREHKLYFKAQVVEEETDQETITTYDEIYKTESGGSNYKNELKAWASENHHENIENLDKITAEKVIQIAEKEQKGWLKAPKIADLTKRLIIEFIKKPGDPGQFSLEIERAKRIYEKMKEEEFDPNDIPKDPVVMPRTSQRKPTEPPQVPPSNAVNWKGMVKFVFAGIALAFLVYAYSRGYFGALAHKIREWKDSASSKFNDTTPIYFG